MLTKIMKWVSVMTLLGALLWRPSAGYALTLQFVVSAAAILVVVQSFQIGKAGFAIVFMIVAALFNPVVPPGLSRTVFLGVGTMSLALFILSVFALRSQPRFSMASITDRTPGSESL